MCICMNAQNSSFYNYDRYRAILYARLLSFEVIKKNLKA